MTHSWKLPCSACERRPRHFEGDGSSLLVTPGEPEIYLFQVSYTPHNREALVQRGNKAFLPVILSITGAAKLCQLIMSSQTLGPLTFCAAVWKIQPIQQPPRQLHVSYHKAPCTVHVKV